MKSNIFSTALFLIMTVFYSGNLSAQWSSNATAIWNTTLTKSVGIGTSTPTAQLDIKGGPCWSTFCWRKAIQLDNANAISFRVSPTVSYGFGASSGEKNSLCLFTASDGTNNTPIYRMIVTQTGNVAIGNFTPSYKLDVSGIVRGSAFLISSDRRYKTEIQTLNGALDKILAMRGTSYSFTAEKQSEGFPSDKQAGFIAQEMQTVMPELVKEDDHGMLAINYIGVIPVLVEAMKEQHEVIAEKETRIAVLEAKNNELQDRLARIEAALGITATERQEVPAAVTATVSPNPTSGLVTVSLSNTSAAKSVNVRVLDSTGHEVASRSAAGASSVQFDLSQFPAGVYFTQIVIDGKVVSANKVQLVK